MAFLDWWRCLSAWVRIPVAIAIMALATCLIQLRLGGARNTGTAAGIVYAIGLILLFTGPTDTQKRGYND